MFTFNGTGTMLYGKRDKQPDGSYIATKWLVLFYLPVLPLGSYRVWPGTTELRLLGTNTSLTLEAAPFSWRQVLNCYLVSLFLGPFIGLLLGSALLLMGWQALFS